MNYGKKIKCDVCNTRNWSGSIYCKKCSTELNYDNIENIAYKEKKKIA